MACVPKAEERADWELSASSGNGNHGLAVALTLTVQGFPGIW